jgi:hypothetical protein
MHDLNGEDPGQPNTAPKADKALEPVRKKVPAVVTDLATAAVTVAGVGAIDSAVKAISQTDALDSSAGSQVATSAVEAAVGGVSGLFFDLLGGLFT